MVPKHCMNDGLYVLEHHHKSTTRKIENDSSLTPGLLHMCPRQRKMVSTSESGSENRRQYFSKGSQVEVSSNGDGFRGSYFVATILKETLPPKQRKRGKNNMKNDILVEYRSFLTEDGSKPLREYVDLASIRPLPPLVNEESLGINDVVDAYYEECWWIGVIAEVLEESKRYSVFFSDPPHVIDFDRSDLRIHFDWAAGKWDRPPKQQELLNALVCQKQLGYAYNSADKPEEALLESSSAAKRSAQVITCGSVYLRKSQMEKSTSHNEKSPLYAVYSGKKKMNQAIPKTDATYLNPLNKLKEGSVDTSVVVSEVKSGTLPVEMEHEAALSVSTTTTMGGIGNVCSKALMVGNQPSAEIESSSAEIIQHKHCRKSFLKKRRAKRGRLPKSSGEVCNGVGGASGEMVVKGVRMPIIIEVESTTSEGFQRENTNKLTGKICSGVGGADDQIVVQDYTSTGLRAPIIAEVESTRGFECENNNETSGKVCNEVGGASDGAVINNCTSTEVELPLLTEVESTSTGSSQHENSLCGIVNQWNESRERQVDTVIQEAVDTPSDSRPDENQSLPFVKHSPIWRVIESWEVFQKMPQKPHFHPLHSWEEVWREGLAISSMVTFAGVVAMTSELKFGDPKCNFDLILEALPDLEMHGFDVEAVRNCLNQLLLIKARQEHLGLKLKEIESQIMEQTRENTHMEEEINAFVKRIEALEEKRAILLSMKGDKDSEIVTLRSSMDVLSEGIQKTQHEFETVAAASWYLT